MKKIDAEPVLRHLCHEWRMPPLDEAARSLECWSVPSVDGSRLAFVTHWSSRRGSEVSNPIISQ